MNRDEYSNPLFLKSGGAFEAGKSTGEKDRRNMEPPWMLQEQPYWSLQAQKEFMLGWLVGIGLFRADTRDGQTYYWTHHDLGLDRKRKG